MKFINNIAIVFFVFSGLSQSLAAEQPIIAPEAQRNLDRLERQQKQEQIFDEKSREKRIQWDNDSDKTLPQTKKQTSLHRFFIKEIQVENDDQYASSSDRNKIISAYLNTEMGEQEVLALVKELTNFYISRGYVTTQVTIVPGSLRSQKLILKVLWGKIAGITYNGKPPSLRERMRMFSAIPFASDRTLNISDIDQGLDNLFRVSSDDKLKIEPTETSGYSIMNHTSEGVFPLSLHTGVNNSGYRDSGWYQYYINTTIRNILGVNDTFSYYYAYNDLDAKTDNQYAKNFSFNLPLGYWSFDTSYYQSKYKKVIGGNYGGYISNGNSERLSLKIGRVLHRDANGKFTSYIKIEKRKNKNDILGFPIAISSKDYSNVSAGLSWVGGVADGWGYIDINMTAGVPWFNSSWKQDHDLNGYDLDYKKYNGVISWSRRLATSNLGRLSLDYEMNSGFQYTNDVLVSDAKYTIGDEYSVRGYKENIVSAERALWIAHTIKVPVQINYARIYQISPFAGFDIGIARHNCPPSVEQCDHDYMSGAATGIKMSGKDFSTSFTAAWPVRKPASLKNMHVDNHTYYFNFDIGF